MDDWHEPLHQQSRLACSPFSPSSELSFWKDSVYLIHSACEIIINSYTQFLLIKAILSTWEEPGHQNGL